VVDMTCWSTFGSFWFLHFCLISFITVDVDVVVVIRVEKRIEPTTSGLKLSVSFCHYFVAIFTTFTFMFAVKMVDNKKIEIHSDVQLDCLSAVAGFVCSEALASLRYTSKPLKFPWS
jgi:hypothetical protein